MTEQQTPERIAELYGTPAHPEPIILDPTPVEPEFTPDPDIPLADEDVAPTPKEI